MSIQNSKFDFFNLSSLEIKFPKVFLAYFKGIFMLPLIKKNYNYDNKSESKSFGLNWYDIYDKIAKRSSLKISKLKKYENSDVIIFNLSNESIKLKIDKDIIVIEPNGFRHCECSNKVVSYKNIKQNFNLKTKVYTRSSIRKCSLYFC